MELPGLATDAPPPRYPTAGVSAAPSGTCTSTIHTALHREHSGQLRPQKHTACIVHTARTQHPTTAHRAHNRHGQHEHSTQPQPTERTTGTASTNTAHNLNTQQSTRPTRTQQLTLPAPAQHSPQRLTAPPSATGRAAWSGRCGRLRGGTRQPERSRPRRRPPARRAGAATVRRASPPR